MSPGRGPSLLVRLAVQALPSWARDRYEVELCAELGDLSPAAQWRHAATVAVVAPSLRLAVLRGAAVRAGHPDAPTSCLLGIRHRWHRAVTDDGECYLRCARCGLDDPHLRAGRGRVAPPLTANPSQ